MPPALPDPIGRYRITAELGRRGNLMVYLGHDPRLDRPVAVKILLPEAMEAGARVRRRFQADVDLLAALEHPCIVKAYDLGTYAGRPYVVMPFLAGGTLAARLAEGPFSLGDVAPVVARVAHALDAAHRRGILHRQIRLENILFDEQAQAYLSDFAPANLLEAEPVGMDRAPYLSPEQARGLLSGVPAREPRALDGRSDVYALGVVLFRALTGRMPYTGPTVHALAEAHAHAPVPRLADAGLPAACQPLIDRALAKDPADRYPTAGAMARHVREVADGRWYLGRIAGVAPPEERPYAPAPTRAPETPDAAPAGPTLGRYRIERELGHGGMALVYLARDPEIRRTVAVKVVDRKLMTDPQFRARFHTEAELVARLDHPAVVPIYDFGEHEARPFLVMPYLPGGTLADRLADGPLPLRAVAPILDRVAGALDAAHARRIIHQDLKPANVLFNAAGEAFLSDFGIAVLVEVAAGPGNRIGGTPRFMSPERVRALLDPAAPPPDTRSDVYALGVMLFLALTGQAPFDRATPRATALAHLDAPIPRLHALKPRLPAACQEILDRALAKDPADRYPTAGALARDVGELAAGRWFLRRLAEE